MPKSGSEAVKTYSKKRSWPVGMGLYQFADEYRVARHSEQNSELLYNIDYF